MACENGAGRPIDGHEKPGNEGDREFGSGVLQEVLAARGRILDGFSEILDRYFPKDGEIHQTVLKGSDRANKGEADSRTGFLAGFASYSRLLGFCLAVTFVLALMVVGLWLLLSNSRLQRTVRCAAHR